MFEAEIIEGWLLRAGGGGARQRGDDSLQEGGSDLSQYSKLFLY